MEKFSPVLEETSNEETKSGSGNNSSSTGYRNGRSSVQFAKDKRKRIRITEKAVPLRDNEKQSSSGNQEVKRKSFNPNFDSNNKKISPDRPKTYNKHNFSDKKDNFNNDRSFKPRPGKGKFQGKRDNFRSKESYPKYPAPRFDEAVRLNRYIAAAGICSRREADDNILAGHVSVNGEVVTELGTKINPSDLVRYKGDIVRSEKKVYIVMNKPKGFVTSVEDPHADKTVMDIVRNACTERIYPVGRLDKNSVGVLLLTNDGDVTTKLTHPSLNKKKIYQVSLDRPISPEDMESIRQGVTLEDGFIKADSIEYVKDNPREVGIEIHSGRNRIVRRIFERFGYNVNKLDRVYFAGLTKKNLKRGAWRFLSPREVETLKSGMFE